MLYCIATHDAVVREWYAMVKEAGFKELQCQQEFASLPTGGGGDDGNGDSGSGGYWRVISLCGETPPGA